MIMPSRVHMNNFKKKFMSTQECYKIIYIRDWLRGTLKQNNKFVIAIPPSWRIKLYVSELKRLYF